MIKALFEQVATPSKLEPLGLTEVLDWTAAVLNRVDRKAFFESFEEGNAVQYFYEPFLEAFDPELRKDLGVWYTSTEVVKYMVSRIETVLREELNITEGLADPRVYVLDPCCGTGKYLVEVLRSIHETLKLRGEDALTSHTIKQAAMERVFGFEILPAPFVVSHLQLGLLLQNLGAPLSERPKDRAGVYLTNALTGWEPPSDEVKKRLQQLAFAFSELKSEHDAAERVKREAPILVILGNPPYNGFAGVAIEEERDLTNAYRTTTAAPEPQGQGLNDLYVRFYRMAERKIVDQTRKGIVCFISNYSWLDGRSFPGMRERYLEAFDRVWIDSLNGDKFKTGKLTPDGKPDPSIFSTDWNREGIQVGTAIALLVRKDRHTKSKSVEFRDLWGKNKRADLLANSDGKQIASYTEVQPILELGLPFTLGTRTANYHKWPSLTQLFPVSFPGVKTSRDEFLVDIDRDRLEERIEKYFDSQFSNEELRLLAPKAMKDATRFDAIQTREYLLKRGIIRKNIIRYSYRPFDLRWLYWEPETKLLDEKRVDYFQQVFEDNTWIAAVQQNRKAFDPPFVTSRLSSLHLIERGANLFPYLLNATAAARLFDVHPRVRLNDKEITLSELGINYLDKIGSVEDAEHLFYHSIAILHCSNFSQENSQALRQDWPRIPLPSSRDALVDSANLGRQIAQLLDNEHEISGVTEGQIQHPLGSIGIVSRVSGGSLQINDEQNDLKINAGWAHLNEDGAVMPGKGQVVRDLSTDTNSSLLSMLPKS